ncbi:MAG: hypothetical protein QM478_02540 [Flavobacteriaceae bacterium]
MKQITNGMIVFFVVISTSLNAQESKKEIEKGKPKHEIDLDFLELIQYNKIELSYSFILNENSSFGATLHLYPSSSSYWKNQDYQEYFGVDFNYQYYFSKKHAEGFYIEGFTKYNFGTTHLKNITNPPINNSEDYQMISLGIGIGYKYIFKNNLFINTKFRVYEMVYKSGDYDATPSGNFDFSVTLGKRF